MRTIPAGLAAAAVFAAVAGSTPAGALPIANLGASQAHPATGDTVQVQWRRHRRWGGYWGPRAYWGPRYYSYGYYPRRYYGGPSLYIGPRGFGFGMW